MGPFKSFASPTAQHESHHLHKKEGVRIIGIDPGLATIGFGIIDVIRHKMTVVSHGAIITKPTMSLADRLLTIQSNLLDLLETHQPNQCGIEALYFSKNVKTAMQVSHARGVILCCLAQKKIPEYHYSPTQVKSALLGYGNASKAQMQFMAKEVLNLKETPKPDDVADALAIAICHHHSVQFLR
jgi:crossover junction endodeoxyribonuclease RuvC